MLEAVRGCFMPCNIFLAGNSAVSLELQCFTAELITYIMCECDAPEWQHGWTPVLANKQYWPCLGWYCQPRGKVKFWKWFTTHFKVEEGRGLVKHATNLMMYYFYEVTSK